MVSDSDLCLLEKLAFDSDNTLIWLSQHVKLKPHANSSINLAKKELWCHIIKALYS